MMILDYYRMEIDPFSLRPDLDFLYLSQAHEEAIAHLIYGLEQQEDVTLLVGDIGTGKTLAIHRLLQQVSDNFIPVNISVTTLRFEELLGLVIRKLDRPLPAKGGLAELLNDFEVVLREFQGSGKKVLLIIDEAQNLDMEALEGVRLLMNLAQPGPQALQLVLSGQLGLGVSLSKPEMRQFKQRIRVEYRLAHLDRQETEAYINHRLKTAGRVDALFRKDALDGIFQESQGVPRLVNHIANRALLAGFVDKAKMISGKHLESEPDPSGPSEPVSPEPKVVARTEASVPDPTSPALEQPQENPDNPPVEMASRRKAAQSRAGAAQRREAGGSSTLSRLAVAFVVVILLAAGYATRGQWMGLVGMGSAGDQSGATSSQGPANPPAKSLSALTSQETPATTPVETPAPQEELPQEAADSLIVEGGSSVVEIAESAPPPVPEMPAAASVDSVPSVGFVIHVASFTSMDRALSLKDRFEARNLDCFIRLKDTDTGNVWHRVYLGAFQTGEEARAIAKDLQEAGDINYSLIVELPFTQVQ